MDSAAAGQARAGSAAPKIGVPQDRHGMAAPTSEPNHANHWISFSRNPRPLGRFPYLPPHGLGGYLSDIVPLINFQVKARKNQ
jgi:hypothetical protein